MNSYQKGHVKHNPATGEVALRTIFPEDPGIGIAAMPWLISTTTTGARSAKTEEVESWDDLFTPQPAPPLQDDDGEVND